VKKGEKQKIQLPFPNPNPSKILPFCLFSYRQKNPKVKTPEKIK
jgi:hypothetical protein